MPFLEGETAPAPRLATVGLASGAAGAGVGLLASGVPRGPSLVGVVCATALALTAAWASAANLRTARADANRELLATERSRLARELHSALGNLAFVQAQANQLVRLVTDHREPIREIAEAAGDAARATRRALSSPSRGA